MSTVTGTISKSNAIATPGLFLLPWISRSLEGLWLLAVFLVPLTFLDREYSLSEAQISYVEVPKVALLRALAGLIAVLWSIEWSIKSNTLQGPFPSLSISAITERLNPFKPVLAIIGWVKIHPTRWLLLAAGLFFSSTVLSTVLSGSFQNSMWGEIPGQDGYSAYTIASYGIVFGVIATHLKSPAQLGRLLGAVVVMGILVGLYGIFQHYEHDFFNLTESTGGGTSRVTIFMGNTIFAAAVLSMTVPITLVAATIHLQNENRFSWGPLFRISELTQESLSTSLWASILAVQLLGLMFTFSRGPWIGAALALAAFIGLVVISLGWRMLIRSGLVLGLAGVLSVGFLHWQGNISIINLGPYLGLVIALLGLTGTFAVLFFIQRFGRTTVLITAVAAVAAVATVVGLTVIAPSALSDLGNSGTVGANPGGESTAGQVGERLSSIQSQVLGGIEGGRATHWEVSWKLIKDHPWFEFDDLSLSWLRPVIGYGPDLFRYTYLLESPPDEFRFLPHEPDHAHNFFIHQTVEQGFLGGFASLALFASVLGVTVHQLLFKRNSGNPVYQILLIGLAAVLFGRFFEMAVGVARISDLTVLWVVFGLFAASVRFDGEQQESTTTREIPLNRRARQRNRRGARNTPAGQSLGMGLLIRFAIVAWVIGGLGVVTWQKSINSVRASVAEGNALNHFRAGDLENTLVDLDKAIRLAPGVPSYHNNRAQVFLAYQLQADVLREPGCSQQTEIPYLSCLGLESIDSNLESVDYQPFYYRSRLAAGNSASILQLNDYAVREYTTAVGMVPNAFRARNSLAESQIDVGSYALAIKNLDRSLRITGDSTDSSPALFLKGLAQYEMGMLDDAEETFKHEISLYSVIRAASRSLDSLYKINTDRGGALNIEYFDRILSENPEDTSATYFRGLAHLALGNLESAAADFNRSRVLGLDVIEVRANLGYSNGMLGGDPGHLEKAVTQDPANALFKAYLGNFFLSRGAFGQALDSAKIAHTLDPELGLAALVRARSLVSLGLESPAKEILSLSLDSNLPSALDYIDRGQIYTHFGEFDNALSDLNQAIRINPNKAKAYNARAKTYAIIGDLESALEDFNSAIDRKTVIGQYFRDRGVLYDILGESGRSASDFKSADSVDNLGDYSRTPSPKERNLAYFDSYKGT